MRTLTSTLTAAQQSNSRKPCPKIVFTHGANSYTYETDGLLSLLHTEDENSHQAVIELQNADGALTALSLKGYEAVISHGLETKAGKEYSAAAPLKVIGQKFTSSEGILRCTLQLMGLPDLLSEDKASDDYEHDASSSKTVKDLITEIADGQPVTEDLYIQQTSGSTTQKLYNDAVIGLGQRITFNKTVLGLAFKLKRQGSPTGNVYAKIYDNTESEIASKVLIAAGSVATSATWYEIHFDSPIVIDEEVIIAVYYEGGNSSNYIDAYCSSYNLVSGENLVTIDEVSPFFEDYTGEECVYKIKYSGGGGISVFDDCPSYDVVYDSEDSLIDTYCPADSFTIRENEDRLSVIDKLLFYTGCQRIFKADGKIHIFVPTTTGTTYNSEYSLASGHPFFAKTLRDALVIPNKVVVRSQKDAATEYTGSATSAGSYALLPKVEYQRAAVTSNEQAALIAAAIISRLEISCQQGGASVPVNCGSELYDYVKVTDTRENDYRVGNLGSITRIYKNYPGRQPEYGMSFNFGQVAVKSVPGSRASSLASRGISPRNSDGSIPWDQLWSWMQQTDSYAKAVMIALGFLEAETPAEKKIAEALEGYLQNVVEDTTPQLGGDLNANGKKITSLATPTADADAANKSYVDTEVAEAGGLDNIVEDTTPQLGGDLDVNQKEIKEITTNLVLNGKTGVLLKLDGVWKLVLDSGGFGMVMPLNMYSQKITALATPTADTDAATKKYVDDNSGGIDNVVEDTTPQLGGDLDLNGHIIKTVSGNAEVDGKTGVLLKYNGTWKIGIDDKTAIKSLDMSGTNVTASRALDTVYQNTSSFPKLCVVSVTLNEGGYAAAYVEMNDITPDIMAGYIENNCDAYLILSLTFMVPVGAYYKVEQADGTLTNWFETTIGG